MPNNLRPTNMDIKETSGFIPIFFQIIFGSINYRSTKETTYKIKMPIPKIISSFIIW